MQSNEPTRVILIHAYLKQMSITIILAYLYFCCVTALYHIKATIGQMNFEQRFIHGWMEK